jgi:hypothetical protein
MITSQVDAKKSYLIAKAMQFAQELAECAEKDDDLSNLQEKIKPFLSDVISGKISSPAKCPFISPLFHFDLTPPLAERYMHSRLVTIAAEFDLTLRGLSTDI